MMRGLSWTVAVTLVLIGGAVGTAFAQQADAAAEGGFSSTLAQVDPEEADRQALRDFMGREEVRRVAHMTGVDLSDAESKVTALEGERLSDAARQARAIERELGAQGEIRLSATVIIIILLLLIIIIVAA